MTSTHPDLVGIYQTMTSASVHLVRQQEAVGDA